MDKEAKEAYEQKLKEMDKYKPFLARLIRKLEAYPDSSRNAQLKKMKTLSELLESKRLKPETLDRCEAVLIKLYEKIEKTSVKGISSDQKNVTETVKKDISVIPSCSTTPRSPKLKPVHTEEPQIIPTERSEQIVKHVKDTDYRVFNADNIKTESLYQRRTYTPTTNNVIPKKLDTIPLKNPKTELIEKQTENTSLEVLRSPPLSADDINILLDESSQVGLDHKDLTELQKIRAEIVRAMEDDEPITKNSCSSSFLKTLTKKDKIKKPVIKVEEPVRLAYKYPRKKLDQIKNEPVLNEPAPPLVPTKSCLIKTHEYNSYPDINPVELDTITNAHTSINSGQYNNIMHNPNHAYAGYDQFYSDDYRNVDVKPQYGDIKPFIFPPVKQPIADPRIKQRQLYENNSANSSVPFVDPRVRERQLYEKNSCYNNSSAYNAPHKNSQFYSDTKCFQQDLELRQPYPHSSNNQSSYGNHMYRFKEENHFRDLQLHGNINIPVSFSIDLNTDTDDSYRRFRPTMNDMVERKIYEKSKYKTKDEPIDSDWYETQSRPQEKKPNQIAHENVETHVNNKPQRVKISFDLNGEKKNDKTYKLVNRDPRDPNKVTVLKPYTPVRPLEAPKFKIPKVRPTDADDWISEETELEKRKIEQEKEQLEEKRKKELEEQKTTKIVETKSRDINAPEIKENKTKKLLSSPAQEGRKTRTKTRELEKLHSTENNTVVSEDQELNTIDEKNLNKNLDKNKTSTASIVKLPKGKNKAKAKGTENKTDGANSKEKDLDISNDLNKTNESLTSNEKTAKDEKITKESLEEYLLDFFKRNTTSDNTPEKATKNNVLSILSEVLDKKKFIEVKQILERPDDDETEKFSQNNTQEPPAVEINDHSETDASKLSELSTTELSTTELELTPEETISGTPVTVVKAKRRPNELEKLNEDIKNMFICKGVLTSTGRRMCTILKDGPENSPKTTKAPKNVKKKKKKVNAKVIPTKCLTRGQKAASTTQKENSDKEEESDVDSDATVDLNEFEATTAAKNIKNNSLSTKKVITHKPFSIKQEHEQEEENCNEELVETEEEEESSKKLKIKLPISKKKLLKRKRRNRWASGVIARKIKQPLAVTVKNNNANIFLEYKNLNSCQLCPYKGQYITKHYVFFHPQSENFSSRVNPTIAKHFKTQTQHLRKGAKLKSNDKSKHSITFQCYFCDAEMTNSKSKWITHLTTHTGEYRYKCSECSYFSAHLPNQSHNKTCKGEIQTMNNFNFKVNNFFGYMCSVCNYIQLNEENLKKHIENEHDPNENINILKVCLINYVPLRTQNLNAIKDIKSEEMMESDSSDSTEEIISSIRKSPVPVNSDVFLTSTAEYENLIDSSLVKTKEIDKILDSNKSPSKSIADKLSERFKQTNNENQSCSTEKLSTESSLIQQTSALSNEVSTTSTVKDTILHSIVEVSAETKTESNPVVSSPNIEPENDENDDEDDDEHSWEDVESDNESITKPNEGISRKSEDPLSNTLRRLMHSFKAKDDIISEKRKSDAIIEKEIEAKRKKQDDRLFCISEPVHIPEVNEEIKVKEEPILKEEKEDETEKPHLPQYRIDKLGFIKKGPEYGYTYEYLCLIEECDFVSCDPIEFEDHLKTKTEMWEGYCYMCEACVYTNIDDTVPLTMEFKHMRDVHIKEILPIEVEPKTPAKPTISLRKLSDLLFAPPKIVTPSSVAENEVTKNNELNHLTIAKPSSSDLKIVNVCSRDNNPIISRLLEPTNLTNQLIQINPLLQSTPSSSNLEIANVYARESNLTISRVLETTNNTNQLIQISPLLQSTPSSSNLEISNVCSRESNPTVSRVLEPTNITDQLAQVNPNLQSTQNYERLRIFSTPPPPLLWGNQQTINNSQSPSSSMSTTLTSPNTSNNLSSLSATSNTPVNVKPWIQNECRKLKQYCEEMLTEANLYKTYKCMSMTCTYCTLDEDKFLDHLRDHEKYAEDQLVTNPINLDTTSWLECSYCDKFADSCSYLVDHITETHLKSCYQCGYCFYRSYLATNMSIHRTLFHPELPTAVIFCDQIPKSEINFMKILEYQSKNVRPLHCKVSECGEKFYALDRFLSHCSKHVNSMFVCQFCSKSVDMKLMIKHLGTHSIGIFECIYCCYGINKISKIQEHLSVCHPSKSLFTALRIFRPAQAKVCASDINSIYLVNFGLRLHMNFNNVFDSSKDLIENANPKNIPSTFDMNSLLSVHECNKLIYSSSLSNKEFNKIEDIRIPKTSTWVTTNSNSITTESSVNVTKTNQIIERPTVSPAPSITIASVASMNTSSSNFSSAHPNITTHNITTPPKVFSINTVSPDDTQIPINLILKPPAQPPEQLLAEPSCKTIESSSSITKSSTINKTKRCVPPVSTINLFQPVRENDIDATVNKLLDDFLKTKTAFACLIDGCNTTFTNLLKLNQHLFLHDSFSKIFHCYFCKKDFKTIPNITKHLGTHRYRYFCLYCPYSSPVFDLTAKHLISSHNITTALSSFPIQNSKCNHNHDNFVVANKTTTPVQISEFITNLIPSLTKIKNKINNSYAPGELDLLPREAIFSNEALCSICNYSTKVKKNMERHLIFHSKEVPVSKNDPVNPVPCLETNEKHFDRMKNLACSSQEVRDTPKVTDNIPQFVPEVHRFVCGAKNCQYLSIHEAMLICHLTTLHSTDKEFKCWHCTKDGLTNQYKCTEEIVQHLRLHDSKLYKCEKCDYLHYQKQMIDRHINEKHPNTMTIPITIRDDTVNLTKNSSLDVGGSGTISNNPADLNKWKCNTCSFTSPYQRVVVEHNHDIHNLKSRYRCELCGIVSNSKPKMEEHSKKNHPNTEMQVFESFSKLEDSVNPSLNNQVLDNSPLWQRNSNQPKHIRGILFDEEEEPSKDSAEDDIIDIETIDKGNNSSNLFVCEYCNYSNLYSNMKAHYVEKHKSLAFNPNQVQLTVLPNMDMAHTQQQYTPQKCDQVIYVCTYCTKRTKSLKLIRLHWKQLHQHSKVTTKNIFVKSHPFAFRISKLVFCYYCLISTPFHELPIHILKKHENQPFASISNVTKNKFSTPRRCGECEFEYSINKAELLAHYEVEHKRTAFRCKTMPDDLLSEEILNKYINMPYDTLYTCMICSMESSSIAELEEHHFEKHKEYTESDIQIKSNKISYQCSSCKETSSDEAVIIKHMVRHVPNRLPDDTNIFGNQNYINKFNEMKIMFPNGFVITKGDAKHLEYGRYDHIIKQFNSIDDGLVKRGRKRKESIEDVPNIVGPKKAKNIPEVYVLSDDEDSLKEMEYSFYGKPRENVDLSKIHTTMVIGGNSVPIACDRFAVLFNINPKVQVIKTPL